MNRGGLGIGSASIVLVFAVLCLTIFALISLNTATADKVMAEAAMNAATSYYQADTLAERVLAEILDADEAPDTVLGVEITTEWDMDTGYVSYSCPVSDTKELYVEVAIYIDSYDILKWQMQDIGLWEAEDGPLVWSGELELPV